MAAALRLFALFGLGCLLVAVAGFPLFPFTPPPACPLACRTKPSACTMNWWSCRSCGTRMMRPSWLWVKQRRSSSLATCTSQRSSTVLLWITTPKPWTCLPSTWGLAAAWLLTWSTESTKFVLATWRSVGWHSVGSVLCVYSALRRACHTEAGCPNNRRHVNAWPHDDMDGC